VIRSALDTLLDRSVAPGYTRLGYAFRRGGWDQDDLDVSMAGKTVLVTGATAGLGLAAAEGFARLGARVYMLGRDTERGERARAEVARRTGKDEIEIALCDLSSLSSVRDFVDRFRAREPHLEVLVNNAGVLLSERRESIDGIEMTLATNVLGPFLLTNLLIPTLRASAPARIVNVSSGGMYSQRIDVEDLESTRIDYDGPRVYARTKRAQVILTEVWAERLRGTGVVVHCMHPGWADTPGVETSLPRFHRITKPFLRSPDEGADTIVWLGAAAEPGRSGGGFWHDRRQRPAHRVPWTKESPRERALLWERCSLLSGWRGSDPPISREEHPPIGV
jgi:NAD(P)-dependent dehydrogenase (short-subunit alcohol dehydrogenase family)